MAKLVISTQVYENYGAHDWDGRGACPQYWKAKGGEDYVVLAVDVNRAREIAALATQQVNKSTDYVRESVIDWEVVGDDDLTQFERDQLEFDGQIRYPAPQLAV